MIAFSVPANGNDSSVFDRPGVHEVARLHRETDSQIEGLDSPADLLAETLARQLAGYSGPLPTTLIGLRSFVVAQFHSAVGPTAVSAAIEAFVESSNRSNMADVVRRMLVLVRSQAKPALTCDALAIAMGIHIGEGRSMEQIASAHGITKQALSKRAIRICEDLGLPPSVLMRSVESRESYRAKQLQRHGAAKAAGRGEGSIKSLKAKLQAAREHMTGQQLRTA